MQSQNPTPNVAAPSGVLAIAADVSAHRISALGVAEAALARIAAKNPDLNAIIETNVAASRADAEEIDRRVTAGERMPLAGVPVAIKDNIWVAGHRVTQGSALFANFHPPEDAIAVARLKRAGAVVIGMANTSEFAAKGLTTNRLYGPTCHPMDHNLTPGGSSGGPVVAVAAGLVPLAIGTDAGGSSRRPAAHVGVAGFKPSLGAVPYGPGFSEPFVGLSCICPIAQTVKEIIAVFDVLAAPDPRDPDSIQVAPAGWISGERIRIAYSPRFGLSTPVDDDVAEAVERAIEQLIVVGFEVVRKDPIWPSAAIETALMPLQYAGLAAIHGEAFRRDPGVFDSDIAAQIERGLGISGAEVASAWMLSSEIARSVAAYFTEFHFDLLIGPTTPCVAWPLERLGPERIGGVFVPPRGHAVFTPFFNHAKVPALSIPCGSGRDGLPVGLQIVAARGNDRRLLAFASRAESIILGDSDSTRR